MVTKVYGDTGVDKIVDGSVTGSDLESSISFDASNLTNVPSASKAYFSAYANANQTDIGSSSTNGGTICLINYAWQNSGDFTLSSGRVTVNKTGKYHIIANMGTYVSSETTSRSQSVGRIWINGAMVTGSMMWVYNREGNDTDEGHGNASASIISDLTAGDIVDIRAWRSSGGDTVGFRGNSSRITIMEI